MSASQANPAARKCKIKALSGQKAIAPSPLSPSKAILKPAPQPSNSMVQQLTPETKPEIIYPDSDGEPMSDNTKQFRWIVTIKENLEILFANNPEVFVAGDLFWYPVQGNNKIRQAPDAMVVFGGPNDNVRMKQFPNWNKSDNVIKLCYNKYTSKAYTLGLVINKTNLTSSISLSPVSPLSTPILTT